MPFLSVEGHSFFCSRLFFSIPFLCFEVSISHTFLLNISPFQILLLVYSFPISFPFKSFFLPFQTFFFIHCHLSLSLCYTKVLSIVSKSIDFASQKHPFCTSKAMLLPSNSIAFTRPLHITSDTTTLTPPRCRTPKTKEIHSVWAIKKKQ